MMKWYWYQYITCPSVPGCVSNWKYNTGTGYTCHADMTELAEAHYQYRYEAHYLILQRPGER